jgi:hypothetical protein
MSDLLKRLEPNSELLTHLLKSAEDAGILLAEGVPVTDLKDIRHLI